jgi:hypothetical protein
MHRSVVIALALLLAVVPAAEASHKKKPKPTAVSITGFIVGTVNASGAQQNRNAARSSTFTHCASEKLTGLRANEKIARAKKNATFDETWAVNGTVRDLFHKRWLKSGSFTSNTVISNNSGLPDGSWTISLKSSGHKLGSAKITIATNAGC